MDYHINNNNIVLRINDLHISFLQDGEYKSVVNGVNFQVEEGKTLGLVGESGSGKSVSSLAVMELLPSESKIDSGDIYYQKPVSMIFQEPMTSLNPVMKCGKQVLEAVLRHTNLSNNDAKQRVLKLFNEVLLPNPQRVYRAYPHQLSGGQKQRVMIAIALACEPKLLIADEPTTALDVTVAKTIIDLLKDLQRKRNLAILFITHDLQMLSTIADNIAVIYRGEIVENGTTKEIFFNPQHTYTKALIASRPPKNRRPKRLLSVTDFLNNNTETEIETAEERKTTHKQLYANYPLLIVSNLSVKYRHITAVDNVTFEVYRGETLGLVGESGCGKTTIGRSILQLIGTQSGDIVFDNVNLEFIKTKQMNNLRKRIQIIFQDPYSSLNPRIKIGEMVKEVLDVHNIGRRSERKKLVISMLQKVGLDAEHYDRYPRQFSGGQRQRIGIARALILNPELVICDESVSALDVSVQSQVLNLLNDLKREMNFTFIFISHDLDVVKYMSDRILVMKKGVIVEQNEADALYEHPKNDYTKTLIAAMP
jgi:peptide/nickel transport system ATP-binding protein